MRRNFVHSLNECMANEAMKDGLFSLAAAYRKKKEDEDEVSGNAAILALLREALEQRKVGVRYGAEHNENSSPIS